MQPALLISVPPASCSRIPCHVDPCTTIMRPSAQHTNRVQGSAAESWVKGKSARMFSLTNRDGRSEIIDVSDRLTQQDRCLARTISMALFNAYDMTLAAVLLCEDRDVA